MGEPTTFADLLAHPGVEEVSVLRSRFGFIAFHGGNLERVTDDIAEHAAERAGASVYVVRQSAPLRTHIPSSQVGSLTLDRFLEHVDVAVAVHGYGRHGLWTSLLVGGSNRGLAAHMGGHLRTALNDYDIVDAVDDIPHDLRGLHETNPVNRPRFGGVQLELPPRVRGLTPHADRERGPNGRIPATDALIDALVATARTWRPQVAAIGFPLSTAE